jgi:hypothetical protein
MAKEINHKRKEIEFLAIILKKLHSMKIVEVMNLVESRIDELTERK